MVAKSEKEAKAIIRELNKEQQVYDDDENELAHKTDGYMSVIEKQQSVKPNKNEMMQALAMNLLGGTQERAKQLLL